MEIAVKGCIGQDVLVMEQISLMEKDQREAHDLFLDSGATRSANMVRGFAACVIDEE